MLLLGTALRFTLLNVFVHDNSIESFEYDDIAKNIVSGRGYLFDYRGMTYRSYGPPLYPFLIAAVYSFFGVKAVSIICFQILLSALIPFVIFSIASSITNLRNSVTAAILSLFHPGLILYSTKKIHALILDALMFSLTLLFILRLRDRPSFKKICALALIFGLTALSRPSIFAVFPFALIWFWLMWKQGFWSKVLNIVLLILITALPISGWAARNYILHKRFVMITTCDSEVFWRGNNPFATGTSFKEDGSAVLESDRAAYEKSKAMTEIERRDFFRKEAVTFIKKNPTKFISLYLRKLCYFWWFSPSSGIRYSHRYLFTYKIFYSLVIAFSMIGVICLFANSDPKTLKNVYMLLSTLIAISLFQSLYYIEGRHRWSIEPILLIFSSIGIGYLASRLKKVDAQTNL